MLDHSKNEAVTLRHYYKIVSDFRLIYEWLNYSRLSTLKSQHAVTKRQLILPTHFLKLTDGFSILTRPKTSTRVGFLCFMRTVHSHNDFFTEKLYILSPIPKLYP